MQGVVIRLNHELTECKDQLEEIHRYNARKTLRIKGILEAKDEKCELVVANFLKDKLGLTNTIELENAFRIGGEKPRAIHVILKNPCDKGLIFQNTKSLKDVTNDEGEGYYVDDHLTAKKRAAKAKARRLLAINKLMSTAEKLKMSFEKQSVMVDGQVLKPLFKPPSCTEILRPTMKQRIERIDMKVNKGEEIFVEDQSFIGYSFTPKTVEEVNIAYAKIKAIHSESRHVICGF